MTSSITKELFGGAITALLPANLIDASNLREVPDNQEVFLYPSSSISIVIEILERVSANSDKDAAKFHFDSLAHDNAARSSAIHDIKVIPFYAGIEPHSAIVLEGTQLVPKFRQTEPDTVRILMVLHRIPSKNVDIVETWNVPLASTDGGAVSDEGLAAAKFDVDCFLTSFKVVDFGLFA